MCIAPWVEVALAPAVFVMHFMGWKRLRAAERAAKTDDRHNLSTQARVNPAAVDASSRTRSASSNSSNEKVSVVEYEMTEKV